MTYHEGFEPPYKVARYLPDGGLQIVLDMTDEPKYIYETTAREKIQTCRRSWLSGMRTDYLSIGVGKSSSMFVIEFAAGNTARFFGFPMGEIANRVIDADSVFGKSIDVLRDRIRNAPDIPSKFGLAEEWLLTGLDPTRDENRTVSTAANFIRRSPTMSTIDSVARHTGVSHKHLIESFRRVIGVTPKQFQRIHRFQSVILEIERRSSVDWTQLALECGYYDQSHFVNEFKRFSGINPTRYLTQKGDERNWVPVVPG